LSAAGAAVDVLVRSGSDAGETVAAGEIEPRPALEVATAGERGGSYVRADGRTGRFAAAPRPGPVVDAYGCGDSFAAGLTFALGRGDELDGALELAARCGAASLAGRGPYAGQLRLVEGSAPPAIG
jgi:ribokinase